jgi:hemerythrin-like domain-containing protein
VKSISALVDEHRLIEQVLNALERMAEEAARRGHLDGELARESVLFFRTFVHGWHFPREEAYVGGAMDPDCASRSEDWRFHDHRRCGELLQEMEKCAAASTAGDRRAAECFVEHAQAYISVLMKHIEDEEDRVFPAVERTLTEEKESEAVRALRRTEAQISGRRGLDACVAAAGRLADRLNVPKAVLGNVKAQDALLP